MEKNLGLKDLWQYMEQLDKGALIKEATESRVSNISRHYHHETVQVDGKDNNILLNVHSDQMNIFG